MGDAVVESLAAIGSVGEVDEGVDGAHGGREQEGKRGENREEHGAMQAGAYATTVRLLYDVCRQGLVK